MTRLQLRTVNNALGVRGVKERLFHDSNGGYFYFGDGDASTWEQSGVYVYRLNHLSLAQWLDHWKRLSGNDRFPLEK